MLSTEEVKDRPSRRHAERPSEAAVDRGIARQQAMRLLDKLVGSSVAERLRPIGCDHTRHDHYRLLVTVALPQKSENCTVRRQRVVLPCGTLSHGWLPLLRRAAAWLAAVLSVFVLVVRVAAGESVDAREDLATLDALVDRWMALRTTIAEEKRDWDERREQWEKEIALLERESASLQSEIDAARERESSVETGRRERLARKESMQDVLRRFRTVVAAAEGRLKSWEGRIPPSLAASLAAGFRKLPSGREEADKLPLTQRAQVVAALYAQIETLQQALHAVPEVLARFRPETTGEPSGCRATRVGAGRPARNWRRRSARRSTSTSAAKRRASSDCPFARARR